jgi:predicted transglutaminase-like cysteine proteinase
MDGHDPACDARIWFSAFGMHTARAMMLVAAAVAAFPALLGAVSAESFPPLPVVTSTIKAVGKATPTKAWFRFCVRHPEDCAVDVSQPARIALSPHAWDTIVEVNERVNSRILTVTDQDHWGVVDRWDYPDDGMGDCEDLQILKRKLLVAAGLPQRALRMAVVVDENGDGHAVLMALTDRGDFILDNKRDSVLPWRDTGYIYLMREGASGRDWVALADETAPLTTAKR